MYPWEQFQGKGFILETVLPFHLSHLNRKKTSKLRERFSARLPKLRSTCSEERFQENLSCFVKNYKISSILEYETKFNWIFFENFRKFFYTGLYLSSEMSYPKFFSVKEKLFPSFFSGFDKQNFKTQIKVCDRVSKAVFDVSRGFYSG